MRRSRYRGGGRVRRQKGGHFRGMTLHKGKGGDKSITVPPNGAMDWTEFDLIMKYLSQRGGRVPGNMRTRRGQFDNRGRMTAPRSPAYQRGGMVSRGGRGPQGQNKSRGRRGGLGPRG